MDYAFLPPEDNSVRMYTGPGSSSLAAAAGSWDALSAELSTTAQGFETVLSDLATWQWNGPASQAMTAASTPYLGWLHVTAEQTKQTARQVRAAAAAYEQAYALTIPPAAVAANRAQLASLIATNLVGQNTSAIAATEAQYADYWAQDVAAMTGYDIAASAARQLTSFLSPGQTTNESGLAAQTTAVAQANATAAATDPVSQAISALTQALSSFAVNPAALIPDDLAILDIIAATGTTLNSTYYMEAFASGVIGAESNLGVLPKAGAAAAAEVAPALMPVSPLGGAGLGGISATLSQAGTVGRLSVPASWAAPATSRISEFTPAGFTTIPGTEETVVSGYPGYPGLPAGAGARGVGMGSPPRYGARLTVMPRPPAAG